MFTTPDNPVQEGKLMLEMLEADQLMFEYLEGKLPHEVEDFSSNA